MADPIVIDPNEFVPAGSTAPARRAGLNAPYGGGAVTIDPREFVPHSMGTDPRIASTPGQIWQNIKGAPGTLYGWAKEHPVDAALTAAAPFIGPVGELAGVESLGGLGSAAARTAAQAGIGAGTAALTGQPIGRSALTGASYGLQGEALDWLAPKITGLGRATNAATGVMRESAAGTAAQQALQPALGMTVDEARALARPQRIAPESAGELASGKRALTAARTGARHEIGQQFNPLYGAADPLAVHPEDIQKISKAANASSQWAASKNVPLSPGTQKLFNQLAARGPDPINVQSQMDDFFANGRTGDPRLDAKLQTLLKQPQAVTREQLLGTIAEHNTPNIGALRGTFSQLVDQSQRPGISDIEHKAIRDTMAPIAETLDNAIPPEQQPLLRSLKDQYSQASAMLPRKAQNAIWGARTLPELGEAAFSGRAATVSGVLLNQMDESGKSLMRRAFASWVLKDGDSATQFVSKLQENKTTVKALFAGSNFDNIDTWRKAIIQQKRFNQQLSNLPARRQFEEGLRESIKRGGYSEEALDAANEALRQSGGIRPGQQAPHGIARWLFVTGPMMALGGFGVYHHAPQLLAPAAMYGGGMYAWRALADSPAMLDLYRQMIMSGVTRKGGEAAGRLGIAGLNDWLRNSGQPQHQAVGYMPDMSEGYDALQRYRAEHIAPTASASDRALDVAHQLESGRRPQVDQDLNAGRLTHTEIERLLQYASSKDAGKVIAGIPISEMLDAVEVASPEEKRMLMPLVKQRLQQELPQQTNRTLQANLARRYRKLVQGAAA